MPGTGSAAKLKKAPPTGTSTAGASPTIITVSGGSPTPDTVNVLAGARIQFINDDGQSYLIRMLSSTGTAPAIDVVLPALASVTLMVDPATREATKEYKLLAIKLSHVGLRADTSGGGGRIIINP
jgi:hypothetical protein